MTQPREHRRWPIGACPPALRVALLACLVGGAYLAFALSGPISVERARTLVDAHGLFAPLAVVAFSAALLLASFPLPLLAGAAGLLFGTAEGTILSLSAAIIGATAANQIARHAVGGGVVAWPASRPGRPLGVLRGRGFGSVLYARILPGVPFTLVSYASGLVAIPLRAFVPATALGVAPRAFAYTALGGHLGDLGRPEAVVAIGVLVGMAVAGLAVAGHRWLLSRRESGAGP